jgi:DNA-binding NarL/FixJ family response regulator
MKKIRILIADDHAMVRQGVRTVIERQPHWDLCGEAANGRQALELAEATSPDVAIIDVSMPQLNGLDVTRALRQSTPKTKVLILTMHNSETLAQEVLEAGASGYLLKSDAAELLPRAIATIVAGKVFVTPQWAHLTSQAATRNGGPTSGAKPRLTPRERSIVRVLAEGKSNKEAAAVLGVCLGTVETHRKNIFGKLGLHCTAELVRYAIRNHLIEP